MNITGPARPDITEPTTPPGAALYCDCLVDGDRLIVAPRYLGLGCDRIIGGAGGPRFRVIDLSLLSEPVAIHWSGRQSGSITDGADSLVFHGVEEIILPPCMASNPRPRAA